MPAKPSIALYAGSFDPITKGHLDVIDKALKTFDIVHVAIGRHPNKKRLFDDRTALLLIAASATEHFGLNGQWKSSAMDVASGDFTSTNALCPELVFGSYSGTIVDHAKQIGATHIVRGLRQAGDFADEFTLTGVAGHLDKDLIFTHFIRREEYLNISSSTVRELARYGSDISWLVTPTVEEVMKKQHFG